MPAQPPFLTPTRTPTIGCNAFAITYLMRSAAASVRRIAWGLARGVAISPLSSRRVQARAAAQWPKNNNEFAFVKPKPPRPGGSLDQFQERTITPTPPAHPLTDPRQCDI